MNPTASLRLRQLAIALGLLALLLAWIYQANLAKATPWYANSETNMPVLADALSFNSGVAPERTAEAGAVSVYLLALDLRIRHHLGLLPVWNIPTLGKSTQPLQELETLVRIACLHSRVLVILLLLSGGVLACAIISGVESGCLTVALLGSSAGLLYHGMLVKPELLGCGLGSVLALICVWHGTTAKTWHHYYGGIFLAGICGGLAVLTQMSGLLYLLVSYAWCWLAAVTGPNARSGRIGVGASVLPLAGAMLLLWLTHQTAAAFSYNAVVIERIRTLALLVGLLPLFGLWENASRLGDFLRTRACELALLAGGALVALTLTYFALRVILPAEAALAYWIGLLERLFYPGAFLQIPSGLGRQFVRVIGESPFLYAATAVLTIANAVQPSVPMRLKAFPLLLLLAALTQTWLAAQVTQTEASSVGVQVPLLMACALALLAAGPWPHHNGPTPWLAPIILVATAVLLATAPLRLRIKAPASGQDDPPLVDGDTVTYLFDHHAHSPSFRKMMINRYGDRSSFERALELYLADPGHRY